PAKYVGKVRLIDVRTTDNHFMLVIFWSKKTPLANRRCQRQLAGSLPSRRVEIESRRNILIWLLEKRIIGHIQANIIDLLDKAIRVEIALGQRLMWKVQTRQCRSYEEPRRFQKLPSIETFCQNPIHVLFLLDKVVSVSSK